MKFGRRDNFFNGEDPEDLVESTARQLPAPQTIEEPRRRPANRAANELNAFLGRGCIYEGKLTFEGRVRIDGKFTGEIFSNDTLEVGPDAELEAEIDVATVIIAGRVNGNVHARIRCDLRAPAIVLGNVTSPIITMDEGVRFDGEMRMSGMAEDAVRAPTMRAPAPVKPPAGLATPTADEAPRRNAPASRDPSELLKPVP
jgi:cytoskeletal protein CcmA (bactofilin family)